MKGLFTAAFVIALEVSMATSASATSVLNYTWTNSLEAYQPGQAHYSPSGDYAAIHGSFGGGSSDHAVQSIGDGSLRLTVDEQSGTLEQIQLQLKATLHGVNVDYSTLQVAAGENGDFDEIDLLIDYDLRGTNTAVTLSAESLTSGALSAAILENIANFGVLSATGPSGATLQLDVAAMVSAQTGCSFCIGDYTQGYNGNAVFSETAPYFATWLPLIGQYTSANGELSSVYASLDINGYLQFEGREEEAPVPEPATAVLLAASALAARRLRGVNSQ